jgi:hypothetical protein
MQRPPADNKVRHNCPSCERTRRSRPETLNSVDRALCFESATFIVGMIRRRSRSRCHPKDRASVLSRRTSRPEAGPRKRSTSQRPLRPLRSFSLRKFSFFENRRCGESYAIERASIEVMGASVASGSASLELIFIRCHRSSEGSCLRLLVSLVVSLLPAPYSRYLFPQGPWLPCLTSLDIWMQCIDHGPKRALGWHALKQA